MLMIVDANSVGHAANAATRLTVGGKPTQAIFGTLNTVRDLSVKFKPSGIMMLWDGRAQWRYDLYPEYKANRNPDPNKKLKPYEIKKLKLREDYHAQRGDIARGLSLLGITQVFPKEDEADDLAGYLTGSLTGEVMLVSRDHDWLQLVKKNVSWFNPIDNELVKHSTFEAYTGYKHVSQFVAEKALMGDTSDFIKGVPGIGETAAPLILNHYRGGVGELIQEVKVAGEAWEPPTKELRRYRKKIIEFGLNKNGAMDVFYRNVKLMSLIDAPAPRRGTVSVVRSELNEGDFLEFCDEFAFYSIVRESDKWLRPFVKSEN
jgi:5'-3' exonuclease